MGKTTLVIGGSGSGKSEFAENYLVSHSFGQRIYIATMQPFDAECLKRIEKHRKMRAKKQFFTIECYTHLEKLDISLQIQDDKFSRKKKNKYCQQGNNYDILLECVSNLIANEMYDRMGRKEEARDIIVEGVRKLQKQTEQLVLVSNDIFSDGIIYDSSTMHYMEQLGLLNQELARMADKVIEVVAGCPLVYKEVSL